MDAKGNSILTKLLEDKDGNIVLWQWPNLPLWGWGIFLLLSRLADDSELRGGFTQASSAFLFVWAYLEITQGVNYLRRAIGLLVLGVVLAGFFN